MISYLSQLPEITWFYIFTGVIASIGIGAMSILTYWVIMASKYTD